MGTRTLGEMTTPTKKLLAFFQHSRDGWKTRYLDLKKRAISFSNQVHAVEKSRDTWRVRAKEAEQQLAELQSKKSEPEPTCAELIVHPQENSTGVNGELMRVRDHEHSLTTMISCVRMYLRAAISFRACPAVLTVLQPNLIGFDRIPAANTVQSWVLRIGVHELSRPKQKADDWVVLADHTCQLGNQKCLLLLGIRLSHWRTLNRALEFQDVTMLTTEVVPGSNGEIVQQQLVDVQGKVGRLAAVVSDQGADLVKGIGLLVEKQLRDTPDETATKVFKDFSHASSHIFKARLLADPQWTEFPGLCGATQPRIKQTPLGGIAPPSQKAKGRYMNIGKIIEWGEGMMPHLVGEGGKLPPGLTVDQIRKHFGWLVPFRRSLQVWGQLHEIRERSLAYLRIAGYHATAAGELKFRLASLRSPM